LTRKLFAERIINKSSAQEMVLKCPKNTVPYRGSCIPLVAHAKSIRATRFLRRSSKRSTLRGPKKKYSGRKLKASKKKSNKKSKQPKASKKKSKALKKSNIKSKQPRNSKKTESVTHFKPQFKLNTPSKGELFIEPFTVRLNSPKGVDTTLSSISAKDTSNKTPSNDNYYEESGQTNSWNQYARDFLFKYKTKPPSVAEQELALSDPTQYILANATQSKTSQDKAVKRLNQIRASKNEALYVPTGFRERYNQISPQKEELKLIFGDNDSINKYIREIQTRDGLSYVQALNRVNDIRSYYGKPLYSPCKVTLQTDAVLERSRTRSQTRQAQDF